MSEPNHLEAHRRHVTRQRGAAMNADRLNEAAGEVRAAINLSTSGAKAHAALDDLLAALDAAEQRAAQAEQERDEAKNGCDVRIREWQGYYWKQIAGLEARLAETLEALERLVARRDVNETWEETIRARAALTTHPEGKP